MSAIQDTFRVLSGIPYNDLPADVSDTLLKAYAMVCRVAYEDEAYAMFQATDVHPKPGEVFASLRRLTNG